MRLQSTVALWAGLSGVAVANSCQAPPPPSVCQADKCFPVVKLNPGLAAAATTICQSLLHFTPPATLTETITTAVTTTVTPDASISTVTTTSSVTITSGTVCTTTVSVAPLTTSYAFVQQHVVKKRQEDQQGLFLLGDSNSAGDCNCYSDCDYDDCVGCSSVITTVTSTVTATEQTCTSTSTSTIGGGATLTCGTPVSTYTSGSISCTAAAAPQQTNARFRIEGNDAEGTIFEGCMSSGPRSITTPSGGTHPCDGTNNRANPSPGATLTTQIDEAGREFGFGYDGSYSNDFSDFFITRIGQSTQTSNQFWGLLLDRQFTPAGGCQEQFRPSQEGLWAFDAFNKNDFLKLSPDFAAVAPGTPVRVTVTGVSGPAAGASVSGAISDANGNVVFQAPTEPGCYVYKATRSDSIRSNAFYLSVF
ncbi:hypothetical protein E8E13_010320 [Curvularia kusanoi]|uniref:Uncharacterized protein n=1 Tax=Curvularia kusanoi TaxID=90978 RepID=A0A9P4WD28_CURKU|nr:hypothetical protein E8E13_010320 [Curvularia kusanoi]